jgi:hypothetical protein
MEILFIGDIVGSLGRAAVAKLLPKIRQQHNLNIVIANVENLAHGKGVTADTLAEMRTAGVDCFTSGNHVFAKKGYEVLLSDENFTMLRPANYPPGTSGNGEKIITAGKEKILLINLMGRVFFREHLDCPFRAFDEILKKYEREKIAAVIVDFHAEATSEKNAFRFYADGRATAIIGTHTHIPTADERISENGTAYITDVGAVMAKNSVLGVDKDIIIQNFLTQISQTHEFPTAGIAEFNAVLVSVDAPTKKATGIKRIYKTITINKRRYSGS